MQNLLRKENSKKYMNNLFIVENLKNITKTLPILKIQIHQKEISLLVKNQHLIPTLIFFKNHIKYQFKILTCISGVDYPSNKYRFKVVYELLSVKYNIRLRIKVLTDELTPVESCGSVFAAASWYESETWDMYGIFFTNHVNLTRLLTDYGFEGYPLRKDFPLSGFVEASYDYTRKRVTNERIELSQEYRSFKFSSPWETLDVN
jgi:NADH/F420H2 dehydrogenase subunit C